MWMPFRVNARCFGLQQEGGAGKLPFHALQQGVAVGVAPAADFGSGQEGEDVRGVDGKGTYRKPLPNGM